MRGPAAVTLTVTDAGGASATTTSTVDFAQETSAESRDACPPDNGAPLPPTAPPRFEDDPAASLRDLLIAASCGLEPAGCTGDIVATVASLALEARRQALIMEAEDLAGSHDRGADARERLKALHDRIRDLLNQERSWSGT